MRIYINKFTGEKITEDTYRSLSYSKQSDFTLKSSTDPLSFGVSAAIGAATDSALLGGLLGGDIIGGVVGDILNGDLFD